MLGSTRNWRGAATASVITIAAASACETVVVDRVDEPRASAGVNELATSPDGSTPTRQAADGNHEPMRLAIAALGPGSRSMAMGVCVEGGDTTTPCDRHVVTTVRNGVSPDRTQPADDEAAILAGVHARLADD